MGPLYYVTVSIVGEPVEAMVDTGSSATLLSFRLVKQIGKKANIPVSALSTSDVVLRDYNQRPIPVGAKVELELSFNGKSMVAPVYVWGSGSAESEACLLGTYVVILLGMMASAEGIEGRRQQYVYSCVPGSTVLFVPRTDWSRSLGMELEDSCVP